jgi:hypothetical protein
LGYQGILESKEIRALEKSFGYHERSRKGGIELWRGRRGKKERRKREGRAKKKSSGQWGGGDQRLLMALSATFGKELQGAQTLGGTVSIR